MRQHIREWRVRLLEHAPGEDDATDRIRELTSELYRRDDSIETLDLKSANARAGGTARAGDVTTTTVQWRRLVDVASSNEWSGRILYRVVRAIKARSAIEVGSNIGIGSCWIASALGANDPAAKLWLLDGSPSVLEHAREHVERVAGISPQTRAGVFDESVPAIAAEVESVDFVFVDGEHYYEPTLRDAHHLIEKVPDEGVVVFDDIAWNDDMRKAWSEIAARDDCALAIEPRHRGSRRLGIFVKGRSTGGGRPIIIDDARGPQIVWQAVRAVHGRLTSGRRRNPGGGKAATPMVLSRLSTPPRFDAAHRDYTCRV